jgi:hypothetical protein
MKPNTIDINILVDTSRSTEAKVDDYRDRLTRCLQEYRERDASTCVSFATFAEGWQTVFEEMPLDAADGFDLRSGGDSSLFEAACAMIDATGRRLAAKAEDERPEKVVFILLTEGRDDVSRPECPRALLLEKIRHQSQVYSWHFEFPAAKPEQFFASVVRVPRPVQKTNYQFVADCAIAPGATPESVFERVVDGVYEWLRLKLETALPPRDEFSSGFTSDRFSQPSIKCLPVADEGLWSLQLVHPDHDDDYRRAIPGVIWTTDIALHREADAVHCAIRVLTTGAGGIEGIAHIRPHLVAELSETVGFVEALPVVPGAWTVATDAEVGRLYDAAFSKQRQIPVVLVSRTGDESVAARLVARLGQPQRPRQSILTFAHVVVLPPRCHSLWVDKAGKHWAVPPGGVRVCYPPPDAGDGSSVGHPAYAESEIAGWDGCGEEGFCAFLKDELARFAAKRKDWRTCLPYTELRVRAAKRNSYIQSDLSVYQEMVETLENDVESLKQNCDEYCRLADDADAARKNAESELVALRKYCELLKRRLDDKKNEIPLPDKYAAMPGWVDKHLGGKLFLHPRAVDNLRNAIYENVPLVYEALLLLGNSYRNARLAVPGAQEEWEGECARLHMEYEHSVRESQLGIYRNKYTVAYPLNSPKTRVLEYHLRRGTARDERRCLRIYFFWDDKEKIVVVGWLPNHLTTSQT